MYQCITRTASNLRWLRNQAELSIEELALLLQKDVETLLQWENGQEEPGSDSYRQLSSFFGLDKSAILLFDLSAMDLFTEKKLIAIQKKRTAFKRSFSLRKMEE
jgi:transcriptional regulator with XRE-family HTH domain